MIRKADIILLVTLLVLSFLPEGIFWASNDDHNPSKVVAVVTVNGKEYKTVHPTGHRGTDTFTIHTDAGYNMIVVKDETIGIVEADCPDQVCVHEGFLSKPGETSVCLPHKVMIEVRADDSADPDIIRAR